jgi:hypothetical protein
MAGASALGVFLGYGGGCHGAPNPARGPSRRLTAQANEADIRLLPEPNSLLVLVAGFVQLTVFNRQRIRVRA